MTNSSIYFKLFSTRLAVEEYFSHLFLSQLHIELLFALYYHVGWGKDSIEPKGKIFTSRMPVILNLISVIKVGEGGESIKLELLCHFWVFGNIESAKRYFIVILVGCNIEFLQHSFGILGHFVVEAYKSKFIVTNEFVECGICQLSYVFGCC